MMSKVINLNRNFNKCFNYKNKHDNFNYSTLSNKPNLSPHHTSLTKLIINSGQSNSSYQKAPPGFSKANHAVPNSNAVPVNTAQTANADSGASGNYVAVRDTNCLHNVIPCSSTSKILVQVANNQTIVSSHTGELHAPDGSILKAYIFPGISGSLLSISQFVDVGYTVVGAAV